MACSAEAAAGQLATHGRWANARLAYFMVRSEEEHLQRLYGHAYTRYCMRVPRYFPSLRQREQR